MPEICRKSPFSQILFRLFLHISLFFHTKTLLIAIPTIKHVSIVKKTYFWSRNCLKIAGTAKFRRKNSISWISPAVLNIFSWNFAHWRKMIMFKMWWGPIFEKKIFFRPKMRKICRKNRFYGIFLRFYHQFFLIFCTKMRINNAQNMTEYNF